MASPLRGAAYAAAMIGGGEEVAFEVSMAEHPNIYSGSSAYSETTVNSYNTSPI